jgi:hypothetical protein
VVLPPAVKRLRRFASPRARHASAGPGLAPTVQLGGVKGLPPRPRRRRGFALTRRPACPAPSEPRRPGERHSDGPPVSPGSCLKFCSRPAPPAPKECPGEGTRRSGGGPSRPFGFRPRRRATCPLALWKLDSSFVGPKGPRIETRSQVDGLSGDRPEHGQEPSSRMLPAAPRCRPEHRSRRSQTRAASRRPPHRRRGRRCETASRDWQRRWVDAMSRPGGESTPGLRGARQVWPRRPLIPHPPTSGGRGSDRSWPVKDEDVVALMTPGATTSSPPRGRRRLPGTALRSPVAGGSNARPG